MSEATEEAPRRGVVADRARRGGRGDGGGRRRRFWAADVGAEARRAARRDPYEPGPAGSEDIHPSRREGRRPPRRALRHSAAASAERASSAMARRPRLTPRRRRQPDRYRSPRAAGGLTAPPQSNRPRGPPGPASPCPPSVGAWPSRRLSRGPGGLKAHKPDRL